MILQIFFARKCAKLVVVMLLLFCFYASCPALSQEAPELSDTIELDSSYFIHRELNFQLEGGDTIFDGRQAFFLRPRLENGLANSAYEYRQIEINYRNNKKQGPFIKRAVYFQPEPGLLKPENSHITIPYRGEGFEIRGQFEANSPSGQWFLSRFEQAVNKAADTVLLLHTFFGKEGVSKQQFNIIDRKAGLEIRGGFSANGNFTDTLEVLNSDGSSFLSYYFDEGVLLGIQPEGESAIQPAYMSSVEEDLIFREHKLDSLYVKILSYYLQQLPDVEREHMLEPLNSVYTAFETLTRPDSSLMAHVPDNYNIQSLLAKLPVNEIDSQTMDWIEKTHRNFAHLYTKVDSLLNIPAFSLNRYVDRELASLYAQGSLLRHKAGEQQIFFEGLSVPLLEHIKAEWLLNNKLRTVQQQDTATYAFHEKKIEEPMDFRFERGESTARERYKTYLSKLEEHYADIRSRSLDRITKLRLNTHIQESEERIASLSASIDLLADTMELDLYGPEFTERFKQAFLDFKAHQLAQFASMSQQERSMQADSLIHCLKQMKVRLENADRLARQAKVVDQAYMENRLNPYTYTEMNVRLYERLFTAYRDILVPYVLRTIRPAGDCQYFLNSVDNLKILQEFMLEALENEPAKLDRRARNRDKPETLVRRLGIPLVLK